MDYQLGETIETGTHTVTYRATLAGEERAVLLKTFKPGIHIGRDVAEAFERERRALAKLDHPALATFIGAVQDDERPALLFLDRGGHRLEQLLDRVERIEPLAAVAIAIQLCGALSAIHRAGEVHGSLRPAVVELTEQGTVYLHGYGSHRPGARDVDTEALMLPEHLAPEQLLGEGADARTDIFALGVLIYRMVAGRSPFGSGGSSISQSIRHEDPPPMGKSAQGIPDKLEKIVARCLKKRRRDRFSEVGAVSSALIALLRRKTPLPLEVLASRAIGEAGLGDELLPPREARHELGTREPANLARRAIAAGALVLVALAALALIWQGSDDPVVSGAPGDPKGIVNRPAQIRVLAHPWAEVHVDGKLVDITPVGRPIEVTPGRHVVLFKHPNAPMERRTIEIIAGQTIVLDVEMQVVRPAPSSSAPEAGPEEASP